MRVARCVVMFACAALTMVGVAQDRHDSEPSDLERSQIEWSARRRLTIGDFKARTPPNARYGSLSWIGIDAEWGCEVTGLISSVRARFDPNRSWWRGAIQRNRSDVARALDERLLAHEQGHFDLAELAARKIRRFLEDSKGTCETGDTSSIRAGVARLDREFREEQRRYDAETGHGTNPAEQAQWESKIRTAFR